MNGVIVEGVLGGVAKLVGNSFQYEENAESLRKKIEELTCRAEDIEERVRKEESSGKKKRKREVENWMNDVKKAKDNFIALQNKVNEEGRLKNPLSGEHVVKLLEQVAGLDAQSKTHHFSELVLDAIDNRGEPRLTSELFGETFKENLEKIKQHLSNDNITSIGIYGMGGVGKTTLAKHVNNDLLKIPDFHVCWLTVSQELSIKKLQDGIARYTKLALSDDDDEEQRAWMLSQKLKEIKKFILILDDVWKLFCLKKLGVSLDAEHKMIFTTRSLGLCHQMLCQEIIQAKTLQPHEAWDLFKATLGYQIRLDEDMEAVARKIVKICGGLPLGIITMAGSMRGVEDLYEWRNALNQLKASSKGLDDMERDVFPVLQWSFSRLNKYHQRCLLCCSLYPEDCIIDRDEIISRFISFDLIVRMDTRKKEYDQGHAILNNLIKSCLLDEAIDFYEVEGIKLHDLIRHMALRYTSGNSNYSDMRMPRYMVKSGVGLKIIPGEEEWAKDLDVVSLMDNAISEISNDTSPQCGNLSALILKDNRLKSIPDSFFAQFRTQLKVLDLSWNSMKELPNCTSEMVNLSTLILEGCINLKSLPPVGKLKKLRELNFRRTSIDNIPQGLEELVNLKYLNMSDEIPQIPEGTLSRLRNLQDLRIKTGIEMKELDGLKQLERFEGCISNIDSLNKFIKSHHGRLWYDRYHIGVGNGKYFFLKNLQFNKELSFTKCNFGNTEGNGGVYQLVLLPQDIERLIVYECIGTGTCLEDTMQLNTTGLNSLSQLEICKLPEVEFLLRFPGFSSPFQVLQKLWIVYMKNLIGIVRWEDSSAAFENIPHHHHHGTFSCLREFTITNCNKITKLFPSWWLQNLQNLEVVVVIQCAKLVKIIAAEAEDSTSSGTTIPAPTLPKLKFLTLRNLPRLRSICDRALFWDSMERILIYDCPNLKRPPHLPTTENVELTRPTTAKNVVHSDFKLK